MSTRRSTASQSTLGQTSLMPDLFGESALPEGFRYMPEVISSREEQALVERFESLPLKPYEFRGFNANRRIYSFGHRYVFAGQPPREDSHIPDYLRPLMEIAETISGNPADSFEQVMVSEYSPGAGIGWHRDRPTFEDIVAFSFLAPCVLRLRRRHGDSWERRSALIEPRSAYLLHGPVRNIWSHSITPMEVLRYSVTLRTFRPGHGAAESGRQKPPAQVAGQ